MNQVLRTSLVVTSDATSVVGETKRIEAGVDGIARAARGAADAMTGIKAPSGGGIQQLVDGITGVDRQMRSAKTSADVFSAAIDQQEQSFKALRASLDPLYRAERQFAAAQAEINRAVKMGVASTEDAANAMRRLEAQYETARQAAIALDQAQDDVGRNSAARRGQVQNLAFQIGDVATQIGSGTSASIAFGQQLPQLLGGFGMLGAVAGAVVAVGVPLASALIGAKDAAEEAQKAIDVLDDALNRVAESMEIAADPRLGARFGSLADPIRGLATALLDLDRAAELKALNGALENQLERFKPGFWQRTFNPGTGDIRQDGKDAGARILEGRNFAALGAGISFDEFDSRREAITAMAKSGDVRKVVEELESLTRAMAGDGAVTDMNAELMAMIQTLSQMAIRTAEVEAAFNGSAKKVELFDEMAARGAERETELARLFEGRIYALDQLVVAEGKADAAATRTASAALTALDDQIRATTDAEGRVATLTTRFDDLNAAAGQIEFDKGDRVQEAMRSMGSHLAAARSGIDDLNDADVSRLEAALGELAETLSAVGRGARDAAKGLTDPLLGAQFGPNLPGDMFPGRSTNLQASREMIIRFEGKAPVGKWDENANRAGYGSSTVTLADGSIQKISAGMQINWADAERDLDRRITGYHDELRKVVGGGVMSGFTPGQVGAIASIQHNYGSIPDRLKPALQTGDAQLIAQAIAGLAMDYTRSERAQGKTSKPMNYDRRMAEAGAFGDTSAAGGRSMAAIAAAEESRREAQRQADQQAREAERAARDEERLRSSITTELDRVSPSYDRAITAAQKWRDEALAGLDQTKAGYAEFAADIETIFQARVQKAMDDDLARSEGWVAGIGRALDQIEDRTVTWADASQSIVTSWSEGAEEAFVRFGMTGKASLDDFADQALETLQRMIYQMTVQPLMNKLLNGVMGSIGGALGVDPLSSALGSIISLPTAHTGGTGVMRSYSAGNPMRGDERLAMIRKGEEVFTPRMLENAGTIVSMLSGMAGQQNTAPMVDARPVIQVVNNSRAQVSAEVEETTDNRGQRQYRMVMDDAVASAVGVSGGRTQKAMGAQYGLSKKGTRR